MDVADPEFEGQTKTRLGSPGVRAAVDAVVGAALLLYSGWQSPLVRAVVAAVVVLAIPAGAFLNPAWDKQILTSAPYLHAPLYADAPSDGKQAVRDFLARMADIVYYREDVATTVTVLDDGVRRYLYVGGKLDAISRSSSQGLLGHLPMLLHPDPQRVLVVGLGSSETLASTLRHSRLREVDCIEISSAVVEAAGRCFQLGFQPLADPRLNLRIGDGRVHMAMTERRYDVIVSQPGNPWMAGASALFTREFFQQMKDRLAPGGVASVWVQGFSASPESVNALVGTFSSVFEHADLWETRVLGDYILTGYDAPYEFDLAAIEDRLREPAVAQGLAWQKIEDAADVVGYFVSGAGAASVLPGADEINVDDHNFLETRLQRELLTRREMDVLLAIASIREDPLLRTAPTNAVARALRARLERIVEAKALVRDATASQAAEERHSRDGEIVEALAEDRRYRALLEQIRALNPRDALFD